MPHSRSAHLRGIGSAISLIVPVVATMAWLGRWDAGVLIVVAFLSLPFYFMTRNRISLEKEHPGWRYAQQAALELTSRTRSAER